jgi:Type I phosphodiesterase / nucleotide pyrophosphatase
LPDPRKLIVAVIDGLTPGVFEAAVESGRAQTLAFLAAHGTYRRAVTTFPSLTPVCLSSIATGAHPDVHEIPHLVWYSRQERRLVEYGSSFAAMRRAGALRSWRDSVYEMNERHLGAGAVTVFEALEDAGLVPAAVNLTCYRGRTRHVPVVPGLTRPVHGPRRFFYYSLFESDVTGAAVGLLGRAEGSLDAYAASVGRWLVTRDGFDLLVYYLPDYDFASHLLGPDGAQEALERSDAAIAALLEAAGGPDEFLDRYALVVCSDHGQTDVEHAVRLQDAFSDLRVLAPRRAAAAAHVAVTASNRAGMVYRLDECREDVRSLAGRAEQADGADIVLFLEDGKGVARRRGEEVRFAPDGAGWSVAGERALLDDAPDAFERAWAALRNPNAGEIIVSASAGYEFSDLAGRHHVGGGSHGSLLAGDSTVPMLTIGLDGDPRRTIDIAPLALEHFGVAPPAYARARDARADPRRAA